MKRIILLVVVATLFSCKEKSSQKKEIEKEKLSIITVNYPLYYFSERIVGDLVKLQYIIPNNVDPAYWKPTEKDLEIYQSSDIIFTNGAQYAKWMEDVSLPSSRIENTSVLFKDELIYLKNLSTHSHGPEGEHEHAGYAFTTWLDFKLALKQAEAIKNTLIQRLPSEKDVIEMNFQSLKKDLQSLDVEMTNVAVEKKDLNLLGSHPVYQYLAKGYNLKIQSVHFEPNEIPSEKQLKEELVPIIDASKSNLMLWEDTPLQTTAEKLLAHKVETVVFNPCGNKPEKGDFLSVMKNNIDNLK